MRLFFLGLFFLATAGSAFGQALRVRAERDEGGAVVTQHGTAYVSAAGAIVTAAHVVDQGDVFVETADGWIRCAVVRTDADLDLALLKPRIRVESRESGVGSPKDARRPTADSKTVCLASVHGKPVAALAAKVQSTLQASIENFGHGGSGAPLLRGEQLLGIVTTLDGRFVPAVNVLEFVSRK